MNQKNLLPGQFVFGISICLLVPGEILAFYFDVPAAFLYAPFAVIPLYLLFSALAHFPVQKAVGLLGIVAVSSSNIWLGWGSAALAFTFMGGAMGFFLADGSMDLFWNFGLGAAPFLLICPFIIVDLNCAIRATRKHTSK